MKKIIIILIAATCCLRISAQVTHEISLNGGGGLSTLNYKVPQGKKTLGLGGEVGIGYTCLFHKNIGILLGADIAFYNAKAKYEGTKVVTSNLLDSEGDRFDMHSTLTKYNETQNAIFVNIPVMLQFQAGGKHKFYALAGAKVGIPVSGKFKVSEGTLSNEAYYPEYDNWLKEQEFAGFGTFSNINSNGKQHYKISAAISAEIGGKWKVSDMFAIYTGAFFDYGLMNICKQSYVNYVNSNPATFTTNSAVSKANLMAGGFKIRLALLPKTKKEKLPPVSTNGREKDKLEEIKKKEKLPPAKTDEREKEKIKEKPEKNNEKQAYINEKQVKKNEKTSNKKERAEKNNKTKTEKKHENITESVHKEVIAAPVEVELTPTVEFTLGRPAHSGFPAAAMGIIWVSNIDANTAKFTTASNKLVILSDIETYNSITTQEKLKEVYEAGNKSSDFTAKGSTSFKPIYIIIQDGETLRLIEITRLTFKAGESKAYFNERH